MEKSCCYNHLLKLNIETNQFPITHTHTHTQETMILYTMASTPTSRNIIKMIRSTEPQSGNNLDARPDIPIRAQFTITAVILNTSRASCKIRWVNTQFYNCQRDRN